MSDNTITILVINVCILIVIGLITYLAKRAITAFDLRFDKLEANQKSAELKAAEANEKLEEKLTICENKITKQQTTLTKIETLESFINDKLVRLEVKIMEYDTNILEFYKQYKAGLDFVKDHSTAIQKLLIKNEH